MPLAKRWSCALLVAFLLPIPMALDAQVDVGQQDTFEDGTTENWTVSLVPGMPFHPAPPANVSTGGPAGAGDAFLLLTSVGGSGGTGPQPGSRMTAVNFMNQWAGDYLSSGITHIAMDVRSLGVSTLFLRLMFEDPSLTAPPANVAFSSAPIVLPAGGPWTRITFPLYGPDGLVPGSGTVSQALANTTALRIYHSEDPGFPNPMFPVDPVVGQLGIDNITAVSTVPEPGTGLLFGVGAMGILFYRRRKRA